MRLFVKLFIVLAVMAGLAGAAYKPAQNYWQERNRPKFRDATVTRGSIEFVVNSTGTIKPVQQVSVGSFVSGPIIKLNVDFNSEVRKGDILALVDPRLVEANYARDKASLATRNAEVVRAKAQLQQAVNDERRALGLRSDDPTFISDSELDQFRFNKQALEAGVAVTEAAVKQAEATLKNSETNREYTEIKSPVDGIIIDRKIDPGQTLAASFQTPELFIVAPDLRKEVHVFASVDEADIGMIRSAQEAGQKVKFTVDAYPDDLFEGTIYQIRMSSTTTQNVVTYPVVVSSTNAELKLMPGMTASISFTIEKKTDVVKIPNSALRFFPKKEHVRTEDQKLLDGVDADDADEDDTSSDSELSAAQKAEARRKRNLKHVWVLEDHKLRAIEVLTGISDNRFTELVEGELSEGQKLITGLKVN